MRGETYLTSLNDYVFKHFSRRASVYRSNFGGNWTRATIFVSQSELSRYGGKGIAVQLRWIWNWFGPYSLCKCITVRSLNCSALEQLHAPLDSLYDWAIDNVYIGEGCPSTCSGHGYCNVAGSGCTCDVGFSGAQCNVTNIRRPNEIKVGESGQLSNILKSSF